MDCSLAQVLAEARKVTVSEMLTTCFASPLRHRYTALSCRRSPDGESGHVAPDDG